MSIAIAELEAKVKDLLEIKKVVYGRPDKGKDGLETRLHLAERRIQKIDLIVVGEEGTHADGILEQVKALRADIVTLRQDLKAIRDDKAIRVEARRSWLGFWGPVIGASLAAVIAGTSTILINLDKIAAGAAAVRRAFHQSPKDQLRELLNSIEAEKSKRGPEVQKKYKAFEDAGKRLFNE